MRKEEFTTLIIYLLMLALAIIVGLTAVSNAMNTLYSPFNRYFNAVGFGALAIIVGFIFNVVMLELLHALGGKVGKYSVVSINVIYFCFQKLQGKWKFSFKDFDGLTGETKLAPKSKDSKLNAYIWFPLIGYVVELVVCIILYSIAGTISKTDQYNPLCWIGAAALFWVIISSMIALYNFVPFKLDTMTDGYRLTLITKPVNREALNEVMRVESLQMEGKETTDIKIFDQVTEFTANLNLYSVYNSLSSKNYDEAEKLLDKMIEQKENISINLSNRLLAQKLYIKILTSNKEDAQKYYDDQVNNDVRRFISNDISMESIRSYVLIAGILDESLGEVQYACSKKNKALKRSLPSRAGIEEKLFNESLEMVRKAHPDWEIKA